MVQPILVLLAFLAFYTGDLKSPKFETEPPKSFPSTSFSAGDHYYSDALFSKSDSTVPQSFPARTGKENSAF